MKCLSCNKTLNPKLRRTAHYCDTNCRSRAYRRRKEHDLPAPPRGVPRATQGSSSPIAPQSTSGPKAPIAPEHPSAPPASAQAAASAPQVLGRALRQQVLSQAPPEAVTYQVVIPPAHPADRARLVPRRVGDGPAAGWRLQPFHSPQDPCLQSGQTYRLVFLDAEGQRIRPPRGGAWPVLSFFVGPPDSQGDPLLEEQEALWRIVQDSPRHQEVRDYLVAQRLRRLQALEAQENQRIQQQAEHMQRLRERTQRKEEEARAKRRAAQQAEQKKQPKWQFPWEALAPILIEVLLPAIQEAASPENLERLLHGQESRGMRWLQWLRTFMDGIGERLVPFQLKYAVSQASGSATGSAAARSESAAAPQATQPATPGTHPARVSAQAPQSAGPRLHQPAAPVSTAAWPAWPPAPAPQTPQTVTPPRYPAVFDGAAVPPPPPPSPSAPCIPLATRQEGAAGPTAAGAPPAPVSPPPSSLSPATSLPSSLPEFIAGRVQNRAPLARASGEGRVPGATGSAATPAQGNPPAAHRTVASASAQPDAVPVEQFVARIVSPQAPQGTAGARGKPLPSSTAGRPIGSTPETGSRLPPPGLPSGTLNPTVASASAEADAVPVEQFVARIVSPRAPQYTAGAQGKPLPSPAAGRSTGSTPETGSRRPPPGLSSGALHPTIAPASAEADAVPVEQFVARIVSPRAPQGAAGAPGKPLLSPAAGPPIGSAPETGSRLPPLGLPSEALLGDLGLLAPQASSRYPVVLA